MAHADAESREIDVASSVDELVGETPLLHLESIAANAYGKVETANPYSVKDRIEKAIVDDAEESGSL